MQLQEQSICINYGINNMPAYSIVAVIFIITGLVISSKQISAGEIRVAVASNFKNTLVDMVNRFETRSEHKVIIIFGSTGKHYA